MRLGKEQAIGVVEVSAGGEVVDEPRAGDADQERFVEEVARDTSPVSGLSDQGALIRTR